jgi:hypothetical protein
LFSQWSLAPQSLATVKTKSVIARIEPASKSEAPHHVPKQTS